MNERVSLHYEYISSKSVVRVTTLALIKKKLKNFENFCKKCLTNGLRQCILSLVASRETAKMRVKTKGFDSEKE